MAVVTIHEAKTTLSKLIAQASDWRFLTELRKELKG